MTRQGTRVSRSLNIGQRVRRYRKRAGLSLDQLARLSGVSKAMISQIEQNKANPTVAVICKIAAALDVGIAELVEPAAAKRRFRVIHHDDERYLFVSNSQCVIRTLSPLSLEKDIEFYRIDLSAGGSLDSESHFHNTEEILTVAKGRISVKSADRQVSLRPGDSVHYSADVNHSIRNIGKGTAEVFLVARYRTE